METYGWDLIVQDKGSLEVLKKASKAEAMLKKRTDALSKAMETLSGSTAAAIQTLSQFNDGVTKGSARVLNHRVAITSVRKEYRTLTHDIRTAEDALAEFNDEAKETKETTAGSDRAISAFRKSWTELNSTLEVAQKAYSAIKTIFVEAPKEAFTLTSELAKQDVRFANLSKSVGMSTKVMAGLQFQTKKTGLSMDQMEDFARDLGERMRANPERFKWFNIRIKESDGSLRSINDVMRQFADRIKGATHESDKLSMMAELVGDEAMKMIPIFEQGSEGIDRFAKEAERLGLVLDDQTVANMVVANRETQALDGAFGALTDSITRAAAPAVAGISKSLREKLIEPALMWIKDNGDEVADTVLDIAKGMAVAAAASAQLAKFITGPVNMFKSIVAMGSQAYAGALRMGKELIASQAKTEAGAERLRTLVDQIAKGSDLAADSLSDSVIQSVNSYDHFSKRMVELALSFDKLKGKAKDATNNRRGNGLSPEQIAALRRQYAALGLQINKVGASVVRSSKSLGKSAMKVGIGVDTSGMPEFGDERQTLRLAVSASGGGQAKETAMRELAAFDEARALDLASNATWIRQKYKAQIEAASSAETEIQNLKLASEAAVNVAHRQSILQRIQDKKLEIDAAKAAIGEITQAQSEAAAARRAANQSELALERFIAQERVKAQRAAAAEAKKAAEAAARTNLQMFQTFAQTAQGMVGIIRNLQDENRSAGQKFAEVLQLAGGAIVKLTALALAQSQARQTATQQEAINEVTAAKVKIVASAAVGASKAGAQTAGQTGVGAVVAVPVVMSAVLGIISAVAATLHSGGMYEGGKTYSMGAAEDILKVRKDETAIIMKSRQKDQFFGGQSGGGSSIVNNNSFTIQSGNFLSRNDTERTARDKLIPAINNVTRAAPARTSRRRT